MVNGWDEKLKSGRVGKDGQRTFHCHFQSVQVGGSSSGPVDYLARDGDFETKDKDLEHIAGDRDAVKEAAQAIDAAAKVRKGRTAEKVLIKQTLELPADTTKEQRAATAEAIVKNWTDRGYPTVAAVHGNGEVQPHIHVAICARPATKTHDTWRVDRNPELVALRGGKQTVRNERERVAKIINANCNSKFHHGRLIDTGIQRKAKKRIPQAAYRRRKARENNLEKYPDLHNKHEADRSEAHHIAKEREADKSTRAETARNKRGDVTRTQAVTAVQKAKREPRALTEVQRKMFADRGISLPKDIDLNSTAQSAAYKELRTATNQTEKRAEKRGLMKGAKEGAEFTAELYELEKSQHRGRQKQRSYSPIKPKDRGHER